MGKGGGQESVGDPGSIERPEAGSGLSWNLWFGTGCRFRWSPGKRH